MEQTQVKLTYEVFSYYTISYNTILACKYIQINVNNNTCINIEYKKGEKKKRKRKRHRCHVDDDVCGFSFMSVKIYRNRMLMIWTKGITHLYRPCLFWF